MKPSKISELLEKVNRLAAGADFSKLSRLELDLLMQHLRDLYNEVDVVRVVATNNSAITPTPETKITKRTINPNENVLITEPVAKKEPVVEKELPNEIVVEQTPTKKEIVVDQATNNSNKILCQFAAQFLL